PLPASPTTFRSTPLFRSPIVAARREVDARAGAVVREAQFVFDDAVIGEFEPHLLREERLGDLRPGEVAQDLDDLDAALRAAHPRSEEHTSALQSRENIVS